MSLTRKFEFPAAGVAVVFRSEVSNSVISEVGRSKYHIIGPVRQTGAISNHQIKQRVKLNILLTVYCIEPKEAKRLDLKKGLTPSRHS